LLSCAATRPRAASSPPGVVAALRELDCVSPLSSGPDVPAGTPAGRMHSAESQQAYACAGVV